VLLFTDGQATDGIKDIEQMKAAMDDLSYNGEVNKPSERPQQMMQNRARVKKEIVQKEVMEIVEVVDVRDVPFTIYTFGYGESHNADLLRQIADARDGVYYFIEHEDSIADSFTDCLGGLLSVVGQNIELSIIAEEDVEIKTVMASYRMTTNVAQKDYLIYMGDLQSEEEKDILINVRLPPFRSLGTYNLVRWRLNYFNVLTCRQEEELVLISSINAMETVEDPVVNTHVLKQKYRVLVSDSLKSVQQLGNNVESETMLTSCLEQLVSSPIAQDEYMIQLVDDVTEIAGGMREKREDQYSLNNKMAMHSKQRNAQGSKEKARYVTNKKSAMQSRFSNN